MTKEITLREAFASDALHENLLSVNQLANDGYDTLFIKDQVFIGKNFDTPDQYQVKGRRQRGAYFVTLNTQPPPFRKTIDLSSYQASQRSPPPCLAKSTLARH